MADYEHITKMENILNTQTEKIQALNELLDFMEAHTDSYNMLIEYYYSDQRKQDLADDENHRIPETLHRGVLCEDSIYNLMEDYYDCGLRLFEVGLKMLKSR